MANALRISGEADVLAVGTRSGAYPVTMLGWARIVNDRDTYSAIFTLEAGPGHSVEWNELVTDSDGTTLVMCDHGSLWATVGTMVPGTWHKVAMVITSGHVEAYFGTEGVAGVALTVDTSITNVSAVDYQGVGASNFAYSEWFDGRLSGVRVWNAALTESEIEAEFRSATPVRTAGILGAWLPPTVEVATVLDAITGDDLIDGAGGGTPHYTIEDGPTLDPDTTIVLRLRSPWPGLDLYLSDSYPASTPVDVAEGPCSGTGGAACSTVAAGSGEEAGASPAAVVCSVPAVGEGTDGAASAAVALAIAAPTSTQDGASAAGASVAASTGCAATEEALGASAGSVVATGEAVATGSEAAPVSASVVASSTAVDLSGSSSVGSAVAVCWATPCDSLDAYSCATEPASHVVSSYVCDVLWGASCATGRAVAATTAADVGQSADAVAGSVVATGAVARVVGQLIPRTTQARGLQLARVRVTGALIPPATQCRGRVA